MNAEVTLKIKIGQMLIIGFEGAKLNDHDSIVKSILKQEIGGVILFDYNAKTDTFEHNIRNAEQLKNLTQQLQHYTQQAAKLHNNDLFPLFVSIDYEGGKINRLNETYGFPKTLSAAALGTDSSLANQYADEMAKTLQKMGINVNFGIVLDVNVNPQNPVISKRERSFSNDPKKVVALAEIFSQAYHQHGIICAYKHFPGHGSSTGDTHAGFVDVTETWKDYELEPYHQLLAKPYASLVMISHVIHYGLDAEGYPASLSKAIMQELLREKLQFKGVIVTDDMQMKAITDKYGLADAVRLSINAGADILVFCNQLVPTPQDPKEIVDMIYADIKAGKISVERIEESYQRIMQLKWGQMSIFDP